MNRNFDPRRTAPVRRTALLAAVALSVLFGTAATAAPKVQTIEVESVTVAQLKVVGGDSVSGTVTLNQTATEDVQVIVDDVVDIPAVVAVQGNPITIPAGSSSAPFSVTTGTTTSTWTVGLQAFLATGQSTVVPTTVFYIMPDANTDLIEITKATMSKSGTLTVTAVSDTPTAVLSATFNGEPVPGESRNGTLRAKLTLPAPNSGIVEVRSDLGGCAQRNPFGTGGTDTC